MFYHYHRTYNRRKSFLHALPKNLTLDSFPHSNNSLLFRDHNTYFKEVKIDKYHVPRDIRDLQRRINKTNYVRPDLKACYNSIKRTIFKHWVPSKLHIISHSAGYDSRILSKAIQELYVEHGKDWLGETLFVESGGESEGFKEIMRIRGFEYEIIDDLDKFLDLETAYQKFNGVSAFPINMFYDPFKQFPQDAQYFSGFGAYVENSLKNFKYWNSKNYYYQFAAFKWWGNWINPFWSEDYILTLKKHKPRSVKRTSELVCNSLISELSYIKRPNLNELNYRRLTGDIIKKVHDEYRSSWLGRRVKGYPADSIRYDKFWSQWVAASWCDHLVKQGYKINLEIRR